MKRKFDQMSRESVLHQKLSLDVLQEALLPFCDTTSLKMMAWTCSLWRNVLNDPKTIWHWQKECWYLKTSGCGSPCNRHMCYLDIKSYAWFLWAYTGNLESYYQLRQVLRQNGRPLNLLIHNTGHPSLCHRAPSFIDPTHTHGFDGGMFYYSYDQNIVATPRIRQLSPYVHRTVSRNAQGQIIQMPDYDAQAQDADRPLHEFWWEHHNVDKPSQNVYEDEESSDPLDNYQELMARHGGNPGDIPLVHIQRMYQHLEVTHHLREMGSQNYPTNHCLTYEQLDMDEEEPDQESPPHEWTFLIGRNDEFQQKLIHGCHFLYLVGVLYEHGPGDAVNWMHAMWTLEGMLYHRLWRECMITLIQYVRRQVLDMIDQVETRLSSAEFREREVQGRQWYYDTMHAAEQSSEAMVRLTELFERPEYQALWGILHAVQDYTRIYLSLLLPRHDDMTSVLMARGELRVSNRHDQYLIHELESMLKLSCFVYHLQSDLLCGGPDGGLIHMAPDTKVMDTMNLRIYLQEAVSLFMFAPGWHDRYPVYPRCMKPSQTHTHNKQKTWMAEQERLFGWSSVSGTVMMQ